MELLYADPKRINVKKTSVFYRLEKITISHADPKFIKLLELGGAQVNIINGYVPWQDYKIIDFYSIDKYSLDAFISNV